MTFTAQETRILWLSALLVVAFKAVFLFVYGPMELPDSGGYTSFGQKIATQTNWMHAVDLTDYWYPNTAFRSIGYPLVIAVAKVLNPVDFRWLVVIFQGALSLCASYMIFKLARLMSDRFWIALFCAVAHAFSQGFLMDQCILTDSLNTSLLLIMTCLISVNILQNNAPNIKNTLLLGLILACAFLIREAGNQLQYLYWILVLFWVLKSTKPKTQKFIFFLSFIFPMVLFTQLYKSWNEYRTGHRFITTAGQTTMYFPALELKKRGINAFENDELLHDLPPYKEPLDQVAPLENVKIINTHLVEQHGMDAQEMSRYAFQKFSGYWFDHPIAMLKVTLSRFREKQAFSNFMPFETMMKLDFWATGVKPFNKKRDLFEKVREEDRYDLLGAYIGRHISRVISILIVLGFVIGVPVACIKRLKRRNWALKELDQKYVLSFIFWLIYFGYTCAYAMVHMEQRYLLPIIPLATMAGMFVLVEPIENMLTKIKSLKKGLRNS